MNLTHPSNTNTRWTAGDLFCGGGGSTTGAKLSVVPRMMEAIVKALHEANFQN
jgi:hypothetical protein